jgi:hypothetical protein
LFTFGADHLVHGRTEEMVMEEFLAAMVIQLLMLFAERVMALLSQPQNPATA